VSISVALATFNGEAFLEEQLSSLARQTALPGELVVCDDGSSDGTLRVLEAFAADAPFPVRVHRNPERLGFANAFLRSASLCTGEAIAFCDQDDVWLERKLERCGDELARDDVLLVIHTSRVADAQLRLTHRSYPHVTRDAVVRSLEGDPWLAVRGMSLVFASSPLRLADPNRRPRSHYREVGMHHDEWVYVLARGLGSIAYVAEPLALYRQHGQNVTGADGGLRQRFGETFSVGWTYYDRRREQALELAAIFDDIAVRDEDLRGRAADAARSYRDQAARLEQRLTVYDPGARATTRFTRLIRLAGSGAYASRSGVGFGMNALMRDATMIALRRTG
jgi:glycosyltransferase involved in cell wall biosynthesis